MAAPVWTTVVAYDTPFLAQLATEQLDEAGITSRLLSDSGGETLPHISFATGGHRVQVATEDEPAAREILAALDEQPLGDIDVGEFEDDDGVQPPQLGSSTSSRGDASRPSPIVVVGVAAVILGAVAVVIGLTGWPM